MNNKPVGMAGVTAMCLIIFNTLWIIALPAMNGRPDGRWVISLTIAGLFLTWHHLTTD